MNVVRPFLRAEWRHLAILNFEVEASVLEPMLPRGLELDRWEDRLYVSLIGFQFLHLRIFGMPVLCHQSFDEVSLRFYVRRKAPEGWRRGAVFIKELVSRPAIAVGARILYNEPYAALSMRHRFEDTATDDGQFRSLTYAWTSGGGEQSLKLTTAVTPSPTREDSPEAFFVEGHWGYAVQRHGAVLEYHVERPRWSVAAAFVAQLVCDVAMVYGERFVPSLGAPPASAFVADGSEVAVSRGVALAD